MDISKAFSYVFKDEQWAGKIGIGALVSLFSFLIIPIPLLSGWMVGITRNVMDGEENPMPVWEDLGALFRDGLSILAASFVYSLPFLLLVCIATVATAGFGSLTEMSEEAATAGIFATFGLTFCLSGIFLLALFFISPAIVIQYVRTNELAACFRFSEVIAIARENAGDIAIAALTPFLASLVISSVLGVFSIIPIIGWCGGPIIGIAVGTYLSAIVGHLYGQIAAKIGGEKSPDKTVFDL